MLKKRSLLSFIVFLIIFMLGGCLNSEKEEEKRETENNIILEKILNDVKKYEISEKKAEEDTFIGEGIYIHILSTDKLSGYEGLYYYSLEVLSNLSLAKEMELLTLLAVSGPKGRVYIVFGDRVKGLFEYESIEDTKLTGITPEISGDDILKKVENTGISNVSVISTGKKIKLI